MKKERAGLSEILKILRTHVRGERVILSHGPCALLETPIPPQREANNCMLPGCRHTVKNQLPTHCYFGCFGLHKCSISKAVVSYERDSNI